MKGPTEETIREQDRLQRAYYEEESISAREYIEKSMKLEEETEIVRGWRAQGSL